VRRAQPAALRAIWTRLISSTAWAAGEATIEGPDSPSMVCPQSHRTQCTLPPPQSDLAEQRLKDPYNFDFLTLRSDAHERDLERGLVDHIQKFLLELGIGFAFVCQQYHMAISGQDYYLDLLFYHLRLRCYVVIDLKMKAFEPEFAGKMNFYLSAVDDQLRHTDDKPSIGLLLCKERDHLTVEYALRDQKKPIGVAQWQTRLVESLPKNLKNSLPTVEEIETELAKNSKSESPTDW
jgi:predicted nuclease of restriction endonuclease-like (RecB) superfamily